MKKLLSILVLMLAIVSVSAQMILRSSEPQMMQATTQNIEVATIQVAELQMATLQVAELQEATAVQSVEVATLENQPRLNRAGQEVSLEVIQSIQRPQREVRQNRPAHAPAVPVPTTNGETTLLDENFDGGVFPPAGWALHSDGGGANQASIGFVRTTNVALIYGSTGGAAYQTSANFGTGGGLALLITPEITVPLGTTTLEFMSRINTFQSGASRFFGTSAVQVVIDGDWQNAVRVHTITLASLPADNVWERRVVDLSQFAGQTIEVEFFYMATYQHDWSIDNVTITNIPPLHANDLLIASVGLPHAHIPVHQATTALPQVLSATVQNIGSATQTNVVMSAEFAGESVGAFTPLATFDAPGAHTFLSPSGNLIAPAILGNNEITFTVAQTETDEDLANNV